MRQSRATLETLQPTQERRRDDRRRVDLWVDEHHDGVVYYQRATDLSMGGLFLERTLPHPPGTHIDVVMRLPDSQPPLRVAAEVVAHQRDRGMAVRFVSLTAHQRVRIANHLLRSIHLA